MHGSMDRAACMRSVRLADLVEGADIARRDDSSGRTHCVGETDSAS